MRYAILSNLKNYIENNGVEVFNEFLKNNNLDKHDEMFNEIIKTFKKISKGLSGAEKRSFTAEITRTFLEGNARNAELIFGWNRNSVSLGLKEITNGIICYIDIHERGNKPIEKKRKT